MSYAKTALLACAAIGLCASLPTASYAEAGGIETVVVTAQKVQENINDVGMSINAASGDQLTRLGVTGVQDLQKIVPGFNYTPSFYGTPIYAIRGVSFQDTSLAASPAVSVNEDEVPLPFSILSTGVNLDLQRVEVLKGPQGTVFGENATGGALNFIANKPTDTWEAGADFSYGRFNTVDLQGYVSGPISDDLEFRVAGRLQESGDWQRSYAPQQPPGTWGAKDFFTGRGILQWKPTESFRAWLTVTGFRDESDTQMPALYGIAVLSPVSTLDPRIGVYPFNQFGANCSSPAAPASCTPGSHYPYAPHNDQAAGWSACVNNSPFDPPFDQFGPADPPSTRPDHSTSCSPAKSHNRYVSGALRLEYDLGDDMTVTSVSSKQRFDRLQFIEGDGTIYQDYESEQMGYIDVTYQELRLSGKFGGVGQWLVGGNYEHDLTFDRFLQTYGDSTANPTALPGKVLCKPINPLGFDCDPADLANPDIPFFYESRLGPTAPTNREHTESFAAFANGEYPFNDQWSVQAGIRFTQTNKNSRGCGNDGGDGTWSHVSQGIQNLLEVLNGDISIHQYLTPGTNIPGGNGVDLGPFACSTTGPGGPPGSPNFANMFHPGPFYASLNENNLSWRAGLNYHPWEGTLLYVNVSKGYKAGSFPTVATSAYTQLVPAKQEGLLAYEAGFKSTVADNLQVNGAAFYYDYSDKQILGAIIDPVFGPLPALVNVPRSNVIGFELSGVWQPFQGLTLTPSFSLQHSRVGGCDGDAGVNPATGKILPGCHNHSYFNYDPFSQLPNLTGEPFPTAPEYQFDIDAEYDWQAWGDYTGFIGANYNYQSGTNGFFYNRAAFTPINGDPNQVRANVFPPKVLNIRGYGLLDLRAGVENDTWRFQVWGKNITDEYYWTGAAHVNDVLYRYTGMPVTYGITLTYRMK